MKTHKLYKHKIYAIWGSMKARCNCKSSTPYKYYGGKGITVCKSWSESFMKFYKWAIKSGWKEGLSIERVKSSGNYSPNNCKLIPIERQSANRSTNKVFELNGEYKILADWCRYYNMDYKRVNRRLEIGWDFKRAISTKVIPKKLNTQQNN